MAKSQMFDKEGLQAIETSHARTGSRTRHVEPYEFMDVL